MLAFGDRPQLIRSGGQRWTDEAEALFLDCLSATCNVKWAAEQAGFCATTAYYHRRRDSAFAERWDGTLEEGYARLEMELVRGAIEHLDGRESAGPDGKCGEVEERRPIKDMSVAEAIRILGMHRARTSGQDGRHARYEGRPRSLDEVRDSILKKIEAFDRAHGRRATRKRKAARPKGDHAAEA